MKNLLLAISFLFIGFSTNAQNSSGGISISALQFNAEDNNNGAVIQYSGDIRVQMSKYFGWQTSIAYAKLSSGSVERELSPSSPQEPSVHILSDYTNTQITLTTVITTKLLTFSGFNMELLVGGGAIKRSAESSISGMATGGLFVSAQISPKVVVGIPLTYNYIISDDGQYYTAGLSLRYHL